MLNEYLRLGWVEGPRTHWQLVKPNDLLDAWAAADDWKKRGALRQYSWLGQGSHELARRLLTECRLIGHSPVFTQWFAASLRVSVYRNRNCVCIRQDSFQRGGFEKIGLEGGAWTEELFGSIVPRDRGVFQATQTVADLSWSAMRRSIWIC